MSAVMERTKTPGVYRRGSRYVVTYRDQHGVPRKRSAGTLAEARELKAMLTADIARGEYRSLSRVGFAAYAREWIDSYQGRTSRGLSETTRSRYRHLIERHAIPFFRRHLLCDKQQPRDLDARDEAIDDRDGRRCPG